MSSRNQAIANPTSYEEMFENYHEYGLALLYKAQAVDPEDELQDMFVKFLERDILSMYDPSKGNFKQFFTAMVKTYHMGFRDRLRTFHSRYVLIPTNNPAGDDLWHIFSPVSKSAEDELIKEIDFTELREHLGKIRISQTSFKHVSMGQLFDDLLEAIAGGEFSRTVSKSRTPVSPQVFMEKYGISTTTSHDWQTKVLNESAKFLKNK